MFTKITSASDWETYKQTLLRTLNIAPPVTVNWGSPPTGYPCLVSTLAAGTNMYSCFVYEQDCKMLLCQEAKPMAAPQTNFHRDITAKMMAVIYYLTETGLCAPKGGLAKNQEAFEAKTAEMRTLVEALFPVQ